MVAHGCARSGRSEAQRRRLGRRCGSLSGGCSLALAFALLLLALAPFTLVVRLACVRGTGSSLLHGSGRCRSSLPRLALALLPCCSVPVHRASDARTENGRATRLPHCLHANGAQTLRSGARGILCLSGVG